MTAETTWQPPLGYTGTRQDAEKLAIARQQMAYENSLAPRLRRSPMRRRLTAAAAIAALALAGLTGCGGSGQWCEHDATDRKVSNRYCAENIPGYEWESSDSSHRRKTKSRTGTPAKTTGPRTTSGNRTSRSGTSSGSKSSSSKSSSSRSSSSRSSGSRR